MSGWGGASSRSGYHSQKIRLFSDISVFWCYSFRDMFNLASQALFRRILWPALLMILVAATACGGDDGEEPDATASADGGTVATADGTSAGNGTGTTTDAAPTPSEAPATTTATTLPPRRSMGVVLLAPDDANNSLNIREGPGTDNPVVGELLPAQAELSPTGDIEVVEGRVWHELLTAEFGGWVYGYYLTEIWTPAEVEEEWDWELALDDFANALVLGEGLTETVSWRGLFAIYFDQTLRRWTPEELPGLAADETELQWSNTGASAEEGDATVGTWKEVIADAFLSDYLDSDVEIEEGGLTLGPNAVLPGSAISSAFANFPWVAIHDPGDDENLDGLDWSTWLVFMELEEGESRVVGLQPQFGYP